MQAFFRGISFRLAKVGVILAFVLGLLMSSVQLYLDFQSQERALENLANRVIEVATPPAARAVHTLDDDLSVEVVNGLLTYDFIVEVTITDELGNVLAQGKKPSPDTATRWLTRRITEDIKYYVARLGIPGYGAAMAGNIRFAVDVDRALAGFFARSGLVIAAGVLRNMLLVLLLFFAFHYMITKPLIRLSKEIQTINPDKPEQQRLTPLSHHRGDELAQLVSSSNQLLDSVELALAKRRAVELALRKSEEHVRQIIDSLPVLVGARNSEGQFIFANKALADFLGKTTDEMRYCPITELVPRYLSDVEELMRMDRNVIEKGVKMQMMEESYVSADGGRCYLQTHIMPLEFYDEIVALVVSTDITERKQAQAKMEHMAYHDSLTNLPNRIHLVERLEHEVRRAQRHHYYGAVLFIDLDQFKTINDSLGHPVGDVILKQVASRLLATVREEDLVARLSGDEFVVVLTVLDQDMATGALKAGEIGEKIRQRISEPYVYDDMELRVTGSVGVVVYPDKESTVHELLRFADTAMYQVKEKGRDAIEFFNEDMADKVSRQLLMEGDLHRAFEDRHFELCYQPKIDTESAKVVGAEVLLRWRHPEKGLISPGEFIPVLETSGLILDVGQWVLEEACRQLKSWQDQGIWQDDMRLSVNISPRQFRRRGFVDDVIRTLQQIPIVPHTLDMEITEGVVIQNVEETIFTMTTLSTQGISFSLDDFGTGYSSISYLKRLPVAALKIDQSFIRDIPHDRNDRVLVETIVAMGRLLGLEIVAEGVENETQLALIRDFGCHYYQGYYASAPVDAATFVQILTAVEAQTTTA
ncbi:EAL domain-containing protein [Exilibacterium tricleocarpae]|uniref:cyclic-guanylate-specific phosphodiesterase n=1 Tax=Exilibacterium tricleocarpae TaxID=2591008 RepID=A0A545U3R4_9GAMM|nr:EAL domain-containing protein [Exilibacterium tricleocarpae]TQV84118.1 EAL domain-containing protein [Exilibacterium tricleocarpae]